METKKSRADLLREIIAQIVVTIFLAFIYGLILICH